MASAKPLLNEKCVTPSDKFRAASNKVILTNRFISGAQDGGRLSYHHAKMMRLTTKQFAPALGGPSEDHERGGVKSEVVPCEDRQTNPEAIVNLLNNCLGSGLLGVASSIKKGGVIASLILILFSAVLNRTTLLLNLRSCLLGGVDPATTEIGQVAFGKAGKLLMVLLFTSLGFFCMVSYVDASADAVGGLLRLGGYEFEKTTLLVGCWLIMLVPPTFMRSLKLVALLSLVAFIGGVVVLACVLCYCCMEIAKKGFPSVEDVNWMPPTLGGLFEALPIFLLIYSVQAGGGVILATMQDDSPENISKVTTQSFGIALLMDYLMGFSCYFVFLDDTQGDVLNNMPSDSVLAIVARCALVDLVVLSYMIMAIPCKVAMIDLIFGKNEAVNEASTAEFCGFNICLNVAALLFALAVSDLAMILDINGAICTNFVAFILPAAFYMRVWKEPSCCTRLATWLLLAFGVGSLVLCTAMI